MPFFSRTLTNQNTITVPATSTNDILPSSDATYSLGSAVYRFLNAYLSGAMNIYKTTNQLVLGTTKTTTISATQPAASRTYTIPDAGAAASFVMTAGAQTIGGGKTFTSSPVFTLNSFTLQNAIIASALSSQHVLFIQDLAVDANFVMSEGNATINGVKTFGDTTDATSTSTGAVVINGGLGVAKNIYAGSGLYLPNGTPAQLNRYEEATQSTTFSWPSATGSPVGCTVNILYHRFNDMVFAYIPTLSGTNGTSGSQFTTSTAQIPSNFRPSSTNQYCQVFLALNGSWQGVSSLLITSGGVITVQSDPSGNNIPASNTLATKPGIFCWAIQ